MECLKIVPIDRYDLTFKIEAHHDQKKYPENFEQVRVKLEFEVPKEAEIEYVDGYFITLARCKHCKQLFLEDV